MRSARDNVLLSLAAVPMLCPSALAAHDNNIQWSGLFHDQGPLFCDVVEPDATQPVTLKFRALKDDLTGVDLQYFDTAGDSSNRAAHTLPMTKVDAGASSEKDSTTGPAKSNDSIPCSSRYEYWQATIPADSHSKQYRFRLTDGKKTVWYNANGPSNSEPKSGNFFVNPGFKTPDWLKNGVIYQIFPDRFFNGDPGNDTKTGQYTYAGKKPIHKEWGESPIPKNNESASLTFYGGDLDGVINKLGYIRNKLGANIVYLNPIFKAPSNHKYDTADYDHVDPCFGTDKTLEKLSAEMHRAPEGKPGYLILDGVFNHTGDSHYWFGRYNYDGQAQTSGAYQSQQSPYSSYYTFSKWPDKFAYFMASPGLPKLDYGSQKVKDAIYATPESVALKYLKPPYKIDGWRLDAPMFADIDGHQGSDKANHEIWSQFRQAVKGYNPQAAIIGEYWSDASPWTAKGDQFDSATNFDAFTKPVSEWITGQDFGGKPSSLSVSQFDQELRVSRAHYPTNVQQAMSNHLSNHDITRFAERAKGDLGKTELALIFQVTYVGVPTIYYGDEYGMRGGKDPDDRRTFDWSQVDAKNPAIELTGKLMAIRGSYSALRTGSFLTLDLNDADNVYAYGRMDKENKLAVVLNNDNKDHSVNISAFKLDIPENATMTDLLSGGTLTANKGVVTATVHAHSGLILKLDADRKE